MVTGILLQIFGYIIYHFIDVLTVAANIGTGAQDASFLNDIAFLAQYAYGYNWIFPVTNLFLVLTATILYTSFFFSFLTSRLVVRYVRG